MSLQNHIDANVSALTRLLEVGRQRAHSSGLPRVCVAPMYTTLHHWTYGLLLHWVSAPQEPTPWAARPLHQIRLDGIRYPEDAQGLARMAEREIEQTLEVRRLIRWAARYGVLGAPTTIVRHAVEMESARRPGKILRTVTGWEARAVEGSEVFELRPSPMSGMGWNPEKLPRWLTGWMSESAAEN